MVPENLKVYPKRPDPPDEYEMECIATRARLNYPNGYALLPEESFYLQETGDSWYDYECGPQVEVFTRERAATWNASLEADNARVRLQPMDFNPLTRENLTEHNRINGHVRVPSELVKGRTIS